MSNRENGPFFEKKPFPRKMCQIGAEKFLFIWNEQYIFVCSMTYIILCDTNMKIKNGAVCAPIY